MTKIVDTDPHCDLNPSVIDSPKKTLGLALFCDIVVYLAKISTHVIRQAYFHSKNATNVRFK